MKTKIKTALNELENSKNTLDVATTAVRELERRRVDTERQLSSEMDIDTRVKMRLALQEIPIVLRQLESQRVSAERDLMTLQARVTAVYDEIEEARAAIATAEERTGPGGMFDELIADLKKETARKISTFQQSQADELIALERARERLAGLID